MENFLMCMLIGVVSVILFLALLFFIYMFIIIIKHDIEQIKKSHNRCRNSKSVVKKKKKNKKKKKKGGAHGKG